MAPHLQQWLHSIIALCQPKEVHLCDGSPVEYERLCAQLVAQGTLIKLNPKLRPNSYLARSNPADTARVEECTFICSRTQADAGPTNNWRDPTEMQAYLNTVFHGCMRGRTMYVIPYCMGPLHSPFSRIGIEVTDSAYVVCNMHLMTHMGKEVLELLGDAAFIKGIHSVGKPLLPGIADDPWPCNPELRTIAHFPETGEIWSIGSGYGGNALLGKKCFALRIASALAKEEGWLAEHMLILSITNPAGMKKYFAAAFPSACGKTNLAMLQSTLPGWKVACLGDDIAWMRFDQEGFLRAINPESGFFGVAPGTSLRSNPNAMQTIAHDTLFTNVALTPENDVWWEGLSTPPAQLTDWQGRPWRPGSQEKAAHANARYTVSASQCPAMDPLWQDPQGVPISAILFGGRRAATIPLVYQAFNWNHGLFLGCAVASETTAAMAGATGHVRHDPFAMLPFCGYNMGDYFHHWLEMGKKSSAAKLPKIFAVNWFRKDLQDHFLWPGFGENIRVLKWIFERTDNSANGHDSPIGILPDTLDLSGLNLSQEALSALLSVNKTEWLAEADSLRLYLQKFGTRFPNALTAELDALVQRLKN